MLNYKTYIFKLLSGS